MCRRKVQPAENWLKAHLWSGFAVFHWRCFAGTCAPRASSRSKASCGKPAESLERGESNARILERAKGAKVMPLNRATVIRNLCGDPELRYLPSGQPAVGFSIATDASFTDKEAQKQERVEWHHIVTFGKLAETCNEYLKKAGRFTSKAVFGRASSRRGTTDASVSVPRSSHPACSI